jgi:hypothetical protein
MAMRCSTALVEPPSAMVTTMAFSNAARVMMARLDVPLEQQPDGRTRGAALGALAGSVAGVDEE